MCDTRTTHVGKLKQVYGVLGIDQCFLCCSYLHIFADGVSLHELSISMLKKQTISVSTDSDGRCSICEQGGHLLCCDGCPRAFHLGEVLTILCCYLDKSY